MHIRTQRDGMTGPVAILLVLVASLSACAAQECERLAHPTECHRYLNLHPVTCAKGDKYDSVQGKCVPDYLVECAVTWTTIWPTTATTTPTTVSTTTVSTTPNTSGTTAATTTSTKTPTTTPNYDECDGVFAGHMAHPSACNRYYNLYLTSCAHGEFFDSVQGKCVPDYLIECPATWTTIWPTTATSATTQTTSSITTSTTTQTTTPITTSTTTASTTPTTTSTTTASTTPTTTSTTTPTTTWTTSTTTSTTSTSTSTPTTTVSSNERYPCPSIDDPLIIVRHAHPSDCTLYFRCATGSAVLYRCPDPWHFSPTTKTCETPLEAACDRCPVVGEARLPHETRCAQYYQCQDGGTSLEACQGELYFSRDKRVCLSRAEAWCSLGDEELSVE